MPSRPGAPGGAGAGANVDLTSLTARVTALETAVPVRYGTKAKDDAETLGIPVFEAADFDSGPHYHRGLFDHASNFAPAFAWPSATPGTFVLLSNGTRRSGANLRESAMDVVIGGVAHQWLALRPSAGVGDDVFYEWYFA